LATKDEETFEPQTVVAHLQVTRPDFDSESHVWRFRYGGKTISVDISETDIADQVRARGYVRIGDTWQVKLLVTEKRTASGQYRNEYKVAEVLEFSPASRQVAFPFVANVMMTLKRVERLAFAIVFTPDSQGERRPPCHDERSQLGDGEVDPCPRLIA
jgi:hypothetical protein